MKKARILLIFIALPFVSCQKASATSADLLKALSAILKHEKDTSFTFPDSQKAMMREVSHYEENAGTSASVVNDSTAELAYDTTASYCRNSGNFSYVSGSDSSGQNYAHYLYKAADGRYLNPVVFSAQKTYTVLEKADFDTQYAQMLSDTKTPIEERAKEIYGWIEWTVNYGMSSSSSPFSFSGMLSSKLILKPTPKWSPKRNKGVLLALLPLLLASCASSGASSSSSIPYLLSFAGTPPTTSLTISPLKIMKKTMTPKTTTMTKKVVATVRRSASGTCPPAFIAV